MAGTPIELFTEELIEAAIPIDGVEQEPTTRELRIQYKPEASEAHRAAGEAKRLAFVVVEKRPRGYKEIRKAIELYLNGPGATPSQRLDKLTIVVSAVAAVTVIAHPQLLTKLGIPIEGLEA